mmetsp:Transcript_10653/g.13193  ORF Transcript_10653/g.13193 Transcript_10653/m.13193 type:complete len:143 (+) Transcript_10653:69-497(+)
MSAKTGVYILGFLSCLGLLSEIENFEGMRFGANLAIAVSFILLLAFDSEKYRKFFFLNYTIASLILLIVTHYLIQKAVFKEQPWTVGCKSMELEGKFKEFNVANQKECEAKLGTIIQTVLGGMYLLFIVLQAHYIAVVYTHW